ncbi:MAG: hypothetical protein K2M12_04810, partial [Muribaculaceae bacterium]|nr:hypothetical protein [Muribaculaceae bacterium]
MYISFDIPLLIVAILGLAALAAFVAVSYIGVLSKRVAQARQFCDSAEAYPQDDADYLPASIIVYSQDEADALDTLLRSIIAQDYPAPIEIIVVNEGESTDVRDTVMLLQNAFPNLYLTHTPDGAHSLSRKKLAITLGVKAARHEVVVLTAIGAEIRSNLWLRDMMRHFRSGGPVELVIGYAAQMPDNDDGNGARCRAFDTTARSVRWLGAALDGHPFRATEFNVAYTRSAFFRNKGFSRSLNLHFGDDDIFISEIAREDNTAVELGTNSIVGLLAHHYGHTMHRIALRHIFTEGRIKHRPRIWATLSEIASPLALLLPVAAVVMCPLNAVVVVPAVI